jgi:biopolymer transport protein ExbD
MAKKAASFDVWVIETNTVYKQVPYTVVTDWAQQGRLLGEDRVRPAGTEDWIPLNELTSLKAFLPQAEPMRAEDQAEALEPVQVEFSWKQRTDDADEDVDMIPLIDISLVLLIFFMMTATVGGLGGIFNTPQAEHHLLTIDPTMYWVGIHQGKPAADGRPRYSFSMGQGDVETPVEFKDQDSPDAVMNALRERLAKEAKAVQLRIRADRNLPCELVIQTMTAELEKLRGIGPGKVTKVFTEVSQKERS